MGKGKLLENLSHRDEIPGMLIANKEVVINLPQWLKSAYTPRVQDPHCFHTDCFVLSDQAKKRLNYFLKALHSIL